MAGVQFENVTVKYGTKVVLDGFSLSVKESEIMGILGPSGCGKTTLMRALCGFIKPQTGDIYLGERLVYSASKRVNIAPEERGIGVVFQDYAVWPHLTVWENVSYPMKKRKVSKDEIVQRTNFAIEQVRMTGYERHLPSQLSGGQQQRVAIARALVSSKDLIVLDEPITNLDAKLREEMILEIQRIQERIGTTILYITHDQEAALRLCDRIAVLHHDGSIYQLGIDEEIVKSPANRFVFTFIGVSNFIPVKTENGSLYLDLEDKVCADNGFAEDFGSVPMEMGIRPNDIIFDDTSEIIGKIKSVTFLGNHYDYFIDLYGKQLRVERNALEALDMDIYEEGDSVGLRFVNPRFYPGKGEAI